MTKEYKKECGHCPGGFGLRRPLFDDKLFWIVCDVHPLIEGHILIIPKEHISCMAALPDLSFPHFIKLYKMVKRFINENYGFTGVFEHGVQGQTVFHAHMHFLPFSGSLEKIIPKVGLRKETASIEDIKREFKRNGKYMYAEDAHKKWFIGATGYPGFFRNLFAKTLNAQERADWESTEKNRELLESFEKDMDNLEGKWRRWYNK